MRIPRIHIRRLIKEELDRRHLAEAKKLSANQKKALQLLKRPKNKAALAFWYLERYMKNQSLDDKASMAERISLAERALQDLYNTGKLPKLKPEIKGIVDQTLKSIDKIFKPTIEEDNAIQDFLDALKRGNDRAKNTKFS